ncbi:MAL2 Alpha-glucosidase [Candida maltosa Xu316]
MHDPKWWKEAIVYQIWPASYKDSNDDGVGDIPGIISTLDYLKDLGTDVVWLSPMYDSPQDDMGYDISDYENVYPKYGTLDNMQELINGCHKRGMKLILDLVINHTSDQHEWFKESRSSKDNPKRDWYIWKPPKIDADGKRHPPNNWGSYFSGSTWKYDELTGEYYLHLFAESQPDLNWENKECREAIYKSALKFWLEKGVDGFRIDTAGMYSKHQDFKDAPVVLPDVEFQPCKIYHQHGPRIHEFHKEIAEIMAPYDTMTVGEVGHSTKDQSLKYVSAEAKEMNMMFLFDAVEIGSDPRDRFRYHGFDLVDFKKAIKSQGEFIEGTDAWSTVFLENHDQPRSISRFGNDSPEYRVASGKTLAMLQCCLTGTEFIYQGQEIGMINVPKTWDIKEYLDINTINYYNQFKDTASKEKLDQLLVNINLLARDNARTPVQWTDQENAGFSGRKPWMKTNDSYKEINVAKELENKDSLLNFWKQMIKIRKEYKDLFVYGGFEILDIEDPKLFKFVKTGDNNRKALVVLNFSTDEVAFTYNGKISVSTQTPTEVKLGTSSLVDEVTREPRLANMALIVETMVKLRRQGHKIVIVSSGAIAFGMKRVGLDEKPSKLSAVQALASIGQGRLIGLFDDLFRQLEQPIAQILITRNDIMDFTQYKNAKNTVNELLEMGIIPIVNENDTLSVSEIKFGDNDTLSAITAGMIHADYLFLMTDVECLYTDNPRTNPDAEPILIVDKIDELHVKTDTEDGGAGSKVGTGGMTTKLIAAELATNIGVTTIITLSSKPYSILDIVAHIQEQSSELLTIEQQRDAMKRDVKSGRLPLHTRFLSLPQATQIKSDRRFWLLHGLKTRGALIIDQGCFQALTRKNRAGLLPAGILEVVGQFHESECVSIKVVADKNYLEDAVEVGHCRVNYSAPEIRLIKGHKSSEIESILGYADSEYVSHRDNLAFPPVMPPSTDSLVSMVENSTI